MLKIKTESTATEQIKAEALALFLFEDSKDSSAYKKIDALIGGRIATLIKKKSFTGKKLSARTIDTLGKTAADTVILIGLGKKAELTADVLRRATAKAAVTASGAGATSLALSIEGLVKANCFGEYAQAATEGLILSQYRFTAYKKKGKDGEEAPALSTAIFSQSKDGATITKAAGNATKTAQGVFLARDLQNHPSNIATPTYVANEARKHCTQAGVKVRVLGKKEILALKMGSFWSVAKGSMQEPKFLIMEHLKGPKGEKPTVLVGKGVTFDTGGISIKPSAGMEEMKYDMSGGAAVIGTMYSAGLLKLKKNIVGLVPLTENMPSGTASKPGDIIRASDGQTIEVLNTDAEGRLILADALVYAKKYKPARVIDIATLTGAMMVALGHYATGLFGNDDALIDEIRKAGEATGERCWPFPLWEEYERLIDSKVADMQNIGNRFGGSITAAAFLKRFTDYPWAHLDIAGTADNAKPIAPYNQPGGAGTGVRLFLQLINGGK